MPRWIFEPGHTAAWLRARYMMVTHVRGGFTGIRGEAHPTIRYRGDRVEALGCNELRVLGELTLRGVTREVPLEVRYLGSWDTPYWDGGEDKGSSRRLRLTRWPGRRATRCRAPRSGRARGFPRNP